MFAYINVWFQRPFLRTIIIGCNTRQCLLNMFEKWKSPVDIGRVFGVLLTDLLKAFDCLILELFIATLNGYGFSLPALRLIHDCLSNSKQWTKIRNSYSSLFELMFRVSQGLLLGQHLFNIFLADLVFVLKDVDILPMTINNDKLNEISRKSLAYSFSFV